MVPERISCRLDEEERRDIGVIMKNEFIDNQAAILKMLLKRGRASYFKERGESKCK